MKRFVIEKRQKEPQWTCTIRSEFKEKFSANPADEVVLKRERRIEDMEKKWQLSLKSPFKRTKRQGELFTEEKGHVD